ncbi:hypothetical protein POM88_045865 [Heracleum sosnowskyi]|uniref:Uncharacterized protein n=1 Tax=Heracleum sosnowskyi TaxID=360622 RepID=A0AAD8H7P0_9APIA|nr:hypothetical protein POM88_045865 [Heracleum sosnowskyi]
MGGIHTTVTVWEALAATTDAAYRAIEEQSNSKEPIIVIISSTKIRTFRNSVQINTLPSSKIYLNLDNEVVTAMRQRIDEEGYVQPKRTISLPTPTENVSAHVIESLSLKELSEKTSSDYLKRNFMWKYRCFKCTRNYPLPQKKYRIIVLAEDETEAFNIVLLDRAARRLIGKTTTKLITEGISDETKKAYPTVVKEISGNLKRKISLISYAVLHSVRKNLARISF